MSEPEEQERRATVRLVNYWLALHRSQGFPAFVDFDPRRNPIPWDQCLLASCAGIEDVAHEHVGSTLSALERECATAPLRCSLLDEILSPLDPAIRTGQPQGVDNIYTLSGERRLLFRSVLLPFRSLDPARHYVLAAVSFKIESMAPPERRAPVEPACNPAPTPGG